MNFYFHIFTFLCRVNAISLFDYYFSTLFALVRYKIKNCAHNEKHLPDIMDRNTNFPPDISSATLIKLSVGFGLLWEKCSSPNRSKHIWQSFVKCNPLKVTSNYIKPLLSLCICDVYKSWLSSHKLLNIYSCTRYSLALLIKYVLSAKCWTFWLIPFCTGVASLHHIQNTK